MVRSRWNVRGLVERAVVADLDAAGIPLLMQHLSDLSEFGKMTLTGRVPLVGKIGSQVNRMIAELIELGAVPERASRRAA